MAVSSGRGREPQRPDASRSDEVAAAPAWFKGQRGLVLVVTRRDCCCEMQERRFTWETLCASVMSNNHTWAPAAGRAPGDKGLRPPRREVWVLHEASTPSRSAGSQQGVWNRW